MCSRRSPMPIRNGDDAKLLLSLACPEPLESEVALFFVDEAGRGESVIIVSGTERPESVLEGVEVMSAGAAGRAEVSAVVVASVRPRGGLLPGDVDRWLEASSICEQYGFVLLEWYVIGPRGTECPRELLGEPERWP